MARLLIIAIVVVALWYAAMQLIRFFQKKEIDWMGLTLAAAFIALAFYLRHVTGMG